MQINMDAVPGNVLIANSLKHKTNKSKLSKLSLISEFKNPQIAVRVRGSVKCSNWKRAMIANNTNIDKVW